jgi:hypothetical protein
MAFEATELSDVDIAHHANLDAVLPTDRVVNVGAGNPFKDNAENRIPRLKMIDIAIPKHGELDGYLKITFRSNDLIKEPDGNRHLWAPVRLQESESSQNPTVPDEAPDRNTAVRNALGISPKDQVLRMPKDFGLGCKLSYIDRNLFRFCTSRHCPRGSS